MWIEPIAGPRAALTVLVFLALLGLSSMARAATTVTDDLGREVRLSRPAERVVVLYEAFGDMLAAMGLAGRIVGRAAGDGPAPEGGAPSVGTHLRPNLELILAQKPDLVVQMAGRDEAMESVAALERLGVSVAVFAPTDFEGLFSVLARLGALTGQPGPAGDLEAALRGRLDRLRERVAREPIRPGVAFEVRWPNLLLAGQGSMVTDIIARAGGRNLASGEKRLARISEEELLRLDPEVYIVQKGPMNPAPVNPSARPVYGELTAVRTGRVLMVEEAAWSRPGPRNVEAAEALAAFLFPASAPRGQEAR